MKKEKKNDLVTATPQEVKKTNSSKSNTWDAGNSMARPQKHKLGLFSLWVLIILYLVAIFADFLAPNNPYDQSRIFRTPPSKVHWTDEDGKLTAPYIYAWVLERDPETYRTFLRRESL